VGGQLAIFSSGMKSFLFHFHWKQTSFFAIFEWNSELTTGSKQMNPSNTVSVSSLIEEIQSELKNQTGSWRKVSALLNQADRTHK
jgi:hypothetical protein